MSSKLWKVLTIDFLGTTEPQLKWNTAIVYLHLPSDISNSPVYCNHGWDAAVSIDLDTYAVKESGFPTESNNSCEMGPELGPIINEEMKFPSFIPSAEAAVVSAAYLVAGENDVITQNVAGSWANIQEPSFNTSIYGHMNQLVAHVINQKWRTGAFTQSGWVLTAVALCTGCPSQYQISASSADLVFVDSSVFGNDVPHKVPSSTYTPNSNILAQTLCNGGSNYVQQVTYGTTTFQHTTNIACSSFQNTDKINKSVFFENQNTQSFNHWSSDITGIVKAFNAKEIYSSNIHSWSTSLNYDQDCLGNPPTITTLITGSLASAGTATWSGLSSMHNAC